MKYVITLFALISVSNLIAQIDIDTICYPIKVIYKICNSHPNDTLIIYRFTYNKLNQKIKFEKYVSNKLSYFIDYRYDKNNKLKNIFETQTLPAKKADVIEFSKKHQVSFYDSINNVVFIQSDLSERLNKDSIKTFQIPEDKYFDWKGRVKKIVKYSSGKAYLSKYKYKHNIVIEYQYSDNGKTLDKVYSRTYDNQQRIIEIKMTLIYNEFKENEQPYNNYSIDKFEYRYDKLIKSSHINNTFDTCISECCDNYNLYYGY